MRLARHFRWRSGAVPAIAVAATVVEGVGAGANDIPWLVTDANDNSAPALRYVGFSLIARRTEMVLDAPADSSAT